MRTSTLRGIALALAIGGAACSREAPRAEERCCRSCDPKVSVPCGDTCIAKDKACHVPAGCACVGTKTVTR